MITTISRSTACEVADQYRLFPVGTIDQSVVCLELDQFRFAKQEFTDITWEVSSRMVLLTASGERTVLVEGFKEEISDSIYEEGVLDVLNDLYVEIRNLPGFLPLNVRSVHFGTFEDHCSDYTYTVDTVAGRCYVEHDNQSAAVIYPEIFLAHTNVSYHISEEKLSNDIIHQKYPFFHLRFGISSVRTYYNADVSVTITTLGYGEPRFGIKNRLKDGDVAIDYPSYFMYNEPVLHHGHSFDFMALRPSVKSVKKEGK